MSLLLPMPWLTEERPDKTRRRRLCLGCGESFEYPVKSVPAVSLVSWIKTHLPCGEFYAVSAGVELTPVPALPQRGECSPLPACPQCGFAGVDLTPNGFCAECQGVNDLQNDGRIQAFIERTGCTRAEVQNMIDTGVISPRRAEGSAGSPEQRRRPRFATERREPCLAGPVPPLNPAGDPCTFTTKPGPLLRRGNVKQTRTKKKPDLVMT